MEIKKRKREKGIENFKFWSQIMLRYLEVSIRFLEYGKSFFEWFFKINERKGEKRKKRSRRGKHESEFVILNCIASG